MITPQTEAPEIAKELGIPKLYLKREDMHPYGSHKGRSIPVMMDEKFKAGARDFAVSSSGNAALAAIRHAQKRNLLGDEISLTVLIGENINPEKKKALVAEIKDPKIALLESKRPLQGLFEFIKGKKVESLRQSTDVLALLGYKELAKEISATPDLESVFVATSSGTAAQALAQYFTDENKHASVHIVQTPGNSPIASGFGQDEPNEKSLADAIVDKVAHRRDPLTDAVKKTKGSGWIATNKDIERAMDLLKKSGIEATGNGALGLAGLIKALRSGYSPRGAVVCVITGK